MQVRAIISAAADAIEAGCRPVPEIMIPLVVNVREIRLVTGIIEKCFYEMTRQNPLSFRY